MKIRCYCPCGKIFWTDMAGEQIDRNTPCTAFCPDCVDGIKNQERNRNAIIRRPKYELQSIRP